MLQSSTIPFSGIFISYRRDDSSGHAGRLFDGLVNHFGRDRIFMDIDSIEPGEDFVTVIENAVGSCDILIAIIGRNWLAGTSDNPRALDSPNDFVRLEITTALNRDIRVIPVLVQRASMPKPQDLPYDLAKFTRRNAVELADLHWQTDVDQLIAFLERVLAKRQDDKRRREEEEKQRLLAEEETYKLAAEERRREAEEEDKKRKEAKERERLEAEEAIRQRAKEERVRAEAESRKRAEEEADRKRVEAEQQAERLRVEEEKQGSAEEERRKQETAETKQRQEEEQRREKEQQRQREERRASETRFRELDLAGTAKYPDKSPTDVSTTAAAPPVLKNKRLVLIAVGALVVLGNVVVALMSRQGSEPQQMATQNATASGTQRTTNVPRTAEATSTSELIAPIDKAAFIKFSTAFIRRDKSMAHVVEEDYESYKTVEIGEKRRIEYGDLDGDRVEDATLWFCGYNARLGESNYWCKLVAFRNTKEGLTYAAASEAWHNNKGYSDLRGIRDGKIIVATERLSEDGYNRIIGEGQTTFVLDGNQLKEVPQ